MGETRVDLLHLLEDLRDAYPPSLEVEPANAQDFIDTFLPRLGEAGTDRETGRR